MDQQVEIKTPWECPRCLRINSPWNPSCFCAPKTEYKPEYNGFCSLAYPSKL